MATVEGYVKIEELRKISEAATEGPWEYQETHTKRWVEGLLDTICCDKDYYPIAPEIEDMKFIAQARNHFDALLEVAEAANKLLQNGQLARVFDNELNEALIKLESIK